MGCEFHSYPNRCNQSDLEFIEALEEKFQIYHTADIGFIFTPNKPIKPANSTVIVTTIMATIAAAHGLNLNRWMI